MGLIRTKQQLLFHDDTDRDERELRLGPRLKRQKQRMCNFPSLGDEYYRCSSVPTPAGEFLNLGGIIIPVTVIPQATTFPRQMYWVPLDRNVVGEDIPYISYIPVMDDLSIPDDDIPFDYDQTYVLPLDNPALRHDEELWVKIAEQRTTLFPLASKIDALIECQRDGITNEIELYWKALGLIRPDISSADYKSLWDLGDAAERNNDSIQRRLRLLSGWNIQVGRSLTDDEFKCSCHVRQFLQIYPNHNSSSLMKSSETQSKISRFLWTEKKLKTLASKFSLAGLDPCLLRGAMNNWKHAISCDMINSLFDRRRIYDISQLLPSCYLRGRAIPITTAGAFLPCRHENDCVSAHCPCLQGQRLCTRFCSCPEGCTNRHEGCDCDCKDQEKCEEKGDCICRIQGFECDPHTCGHYNCNNMAIFEGAMRKPVRLIIKPSTIAGWGCFAAEFISEGSFIMEYTGEIVLEAEAERRGFWYDRLKSNFLYDLDSETVLDGTYGGSLMRFCNHSNDPNAFGEVRWVRGALRIGIFAKNDIQIDEEIFIDYGEQYVNKQFGNH